MNLKTSKIAIAATLILYTTNLFAGDNLITPYDVMNLKNVVEVSVSPNNQHIAFTLTVPRPFSDQPGTDYRELYLLDTSTGESTPLIAGKNTLFSIGWTPNGMISFRHSNSETTGMQVFKIDPEGGSPSPVTQFDRSILNYRYISPHIIAFTSESEPDDAFNRFQEQGFDVKIYEEEFRHINLYLYNTQNNEVTQITSGVTIFDFDISPCGKYAAAAVAEKNLVDHSYMFKDIFIIDLETKAMDLLIEIPGKLGTIAWSPDGNRIAFVAASGVNDAVAGSLYVIDREKEQKFENLNNYVEGMRTSVIDVSWKTSETFLFISEEGVDMVLSEQNIDGSPRRLLIAPGEVVFRSISRSGNLIAFSGNTHENPNELYTVDISDGEIKKRTDSNPWLAGKIFGKQEKIVYYSKDGLDIEGVLIYPVGYESGKSYPLITYIHGGPEAANQNGWVTRYSIWGQVAASEGYFFFMPNYRAGSGRGVDFTMEGFGDLVGKEYDDVIDGIDYLIDLGYVDEKLVGIGGGSYGGYFAAWSATKHTERFAASVVFVGISNQISKRNTTDIPYEDYLVHWGFWTHENTEQVWNASPVKYAPGSLTPTLILHGNQDPRVHPAQGLELYRTLKLHGKAPVRLIWYQGEGHGNAKNTNRLDYLVRTMDWFNYYLKDYGPKDQMPPKYIEFEID